MTKRDSLGMLAALLLGLAACSGVDASGGESGDETTDLDVSEEDSSTEDTDAEERGGFDTKDGELGAVLTELELPSCEDAPLEIDCQSVDALDADAVGWSDGAFERAALRPVE